MADFASRLRNLRKDAGLTQTQLAEELNVKKSTISAYESDIRRPNKDTLVKIANLFSVTTDWLLGLDARAEILNLTGFSERDIRVIKKFIASLIDARNKEKSDK